MVTNTCTCELHSIPSLSSNCSNWSSIVIAYNTCYGLLVVMNGLRIVQIRQVSHETEQGHLQEIWSLSLPPQSLPLAHVQRRK